MRDSELNTKVLCTTASSLSTCHDVEPDAQPLMQWRGLPHKAACALSDDAVGDIDLSCACRVSWNGDGSQLMSASDDRSVRVWLVKLTAAEQTDVRQQQVASPEAAPVLYGHSARLWDCQFGETILITASEDCTARCVPQQQIPDASAVFMVWTRMRISDDSQFCCHRH